MSRFKMFTGVCLIVQAVSFFVLLIVSATGKKKRAALLAVAATGSCVAGTYLLIKGAKEYVPHECCNHDCDDEVIEDEHIDDIDCSFADEDVIIDAAEEL